MVTFLMLLLDSLIFALIMLVLIKGWRLYLDTKQKYKKTLYKADEKKVVNLSHDKSFTAKGYEAPVSNPFNVGPERDVDDLVPFNFHQTELMARGGDGLDENEFTSTMRSGETIQLEQVNLENAQESQDVDTQLDETPQYEEELSTIEELPEAQLQEPLQEQLSPTDFIRSLRAEENVANSKLKQMGGADTETGEIIGDPSVDELSKIMLQGLAHQEEYESTSENQDEQDESESSETTSDYYQDFEPAMPTVIENDYQDEDIERESAYRSSAVGSFAGPSGIETLD